MKKPPEMLLLPGLLIDLGFRHNNTLKDIKCFECREMPYYVKNGVILWYNTPIQDGNENAYLVGYGEMRCGKYHAVSIRWIYTLEELKPIYEIFTQTDIYTK